MYQTNREPGPFGSMRMRVAMAHGSVAPGPTGFVGQAPITACRLLDSPQLKRALAARPDVDAAFIVPDELYQDVIKQEFPDLSADGFARTDIRVKEYAGVAWMYLPGSGPAVNTVSATALWSSVATSVVVAGIATSAAGSGFGPGAVGLASGYVSADGGEIGDADQDAWDEEFGTHTEPDLEEHDGDPHEFDDEYEEAIELDHGGHGSTEVSDGFVDVDEFAGPDDDHDGDYSDVAF